MSFVVTTEKYDEVTNRRVPTGRVVDADAFDVLESATLVFVTADGAKVAAFRDWVTVELVETGE